ncbi:Decapping and exoribonuclease protein [Eumeta japonica]|uniref:Decapping nuclease n=1 Tax=Eumeta variegata TaxID=151549 RepID=A0A4C1X1Z1_EUMVA|nr:Decapping and exoribonuclease protein [Eumeta japonica]
MKEGVGQRNSHSLKKRQQRSFTFVAYAPYTEPDTDVPVDENEEFSLVYFASLSKHSIVYGAEMDGIHCDTRKMESPPDTELGVDETIKYLMNKKFIELKTNRHIEFPRQQINFRRYKTKKWWCQSFFGSVETILCGFRNDNGIVEELKVFSIRDLVKMSEGIQAKLRLGSFRPGLTRVELCLLHKDFIAPQLPPSFTYPLLWP